MSRSNEQDMLGKLKQLDAAQVGRPLIISKFDEQRDWPKHVSKLLKVFRNAQETPKTTTPRPLPILAFQCANFK